jgi:hypothetical protein
MLLVVACGGKTTPATATESSVRAASTTPGVSQPAASLMAPDCAQSLAVVITAMTKQAASKNVGAEATLVKFSSQLRDGLVTTCAVDAWSSATRSCLAIATTIESADQCWLSSTELQRAHVKQVMNNATANAELVIGSTERKP